MKYSHVYCRFHQEIDLLLGNTQSSSCKAALRKSIGSESRQKELQANILKLSSQSKEERRVFFEELESRLKDIASKKGVKSYFPKSERRENRSDFWGGEMKLMIKRRRGWHMAGTFGAWLWPDSTKNPEQLRLHIFVWVSGGRSAALAVQAVLRERFRKATLAKESLGWAHSSVVLTSLTVTKNKSATTLADEVARSFKRLRAKEWKAIFEAYKANS